MKTLFKLACITVIMFIVGSCSGYTDLFDGKTLDGWEVLPAEFSGDWRVEEALLIGENAGMKGSEIWTKGVYQNYELELEYITLTDDYDTGVYPRGKGTQVQIGVSRSLDKDMTACIYAPKDEKGSYPCQKKVVLDCSYMQVYT